MVVSSERGVVSTGLVAVLMTVTGGVLFGSLLATAGVVGPGVEPSTLHQVAVPYYECPGGEPVGTFQRGDRVWALGTIDETWIVVRDAQNLNKPAIVDSGAVVLDEVSASAVSETRFVVEEANDPYSVGIAKCSLRPTRGGSTEVELLIAPTNAPTTTVVGETTTTTTTISAGKATSTTQPSSGPSVPPPTVSTLGTTYIDPFPSIPGGPSTSGLFESTGGSPPNCNVTTVGPTQATMSVTYSAPGGLASARLSWSVGGISSSAAMSAGGGSASAILGPFPHGTVPLSSSLPISVTATITDAYGRAATSSTTIPLFDCNLI